MANIAIPALIDGAQLSNEHYLLSLLRQATAQNLLGQDRQAAINQQLLILLDRKIKKLTRNESSSVRTETAQNLLTSISFTISLRLKQCAAPDQALLLLATEPLSALLEQGQHLLGEMINKAGLMLVAVQRSKLTTLNYAYNDTIRDLPDFFPAYDPVFAAQDIPVMIDYPPGNPPIDSAGIEYYDEYLRRMLRQNNFCRRFPPQQLHTMLLSYDRDYQWQIFNIADAVGEYLTACADSIDIPTK